MGLDVVVSEEAFLSTYKNGVRNARDYAKAHELAMEHYTYANIARAIGRHQSTIKGWLRNKHMPDSIAGLEHVKQLGLVPLTAQSEKLVPLVRLCAWTFWSGCISKEYDIVISEKIWRLTTLQDYFKQTLGLESTLKEEPSTIRFNGNSHYHGRLLASMGVPVATRKSTSELHIPHAISGCPETAIPFLNVLFTTRTERNGSYWTINIPANRDYERALSFGKEVIAYINAALPKAHIEGKQLSILMRTIPSGYTNKKNSIYIPRISLHKENLIRIVDNYHQLIL
ncbi:MAG: hypothetical protein QW165_02905 [Candidatus Woesearchaeota archaeon]